MYGETSSDDLIFRYYKSKNGPRYKHVSELSTSDVCLAEVKCSCVTTNAISSPFWIFTHYGIYGITNGHNEVVDKVNELRNKGYTILGGNISMTGLSDSNYSAGAPAWDCIICSTTSYLGVPSSWGCIGRAYQTVRFNVNILYSRPHDE